MDDHLSTNVTSPRRRRALTWGIVGLAGVLMSTAWATGFATSDSDAAGTGPAQNAFGQGAVEEQSLSAYAAAVTAQAPDLQISFDGLWGQIAADSNLFEVDLTGFTGTFFVDIYVDNLPFISPWSSAQVKWHRFDSTCALADAAAYDLVDTTAPDSDTPTLPKAMNVTTADAHVSFQTLTGGNTYCFGIASTDLTSELADPNNGVDLHADDEVGTFLTRPDSGVVPTAPDFTAIVNRSSNA